MSRTSFSLCLGIVAGACCFSASEALAVWFNPVGLGAVTAFGGYGGWGGGWGGGTVAGNYMQGMSQVVAAQGQYNESTARAAISYEEARSKYIDNSKKWTDTYFQMREENEARTAERRERAKHSPETLRLAAQSGLPRPLSSEALDPLTGRIQWPEALQAPEYAQSREKLERLFEIRATTSGGGTGMSIQQATREMIEILKSNIQKIPTGDYIAARKFLDSLAHSAAS
ncbi:MAG: hypothetical protein ACT4QC_07435 [Planctomycetaceae bacterium]